MPRPPRVFEPDRLYFITQRTFQSRLFLRPSAALNGIVGGVLARALSLYSVELFAFIIMSNHVHFIMRGEVGQISRFMNYFSGMVGYRVGKLVGWCSISLNVPTRFQRMVPPEFHFRGEPERQRRGVLNI